MGDARHGADRGHCAEFLGYLLGQRLQERHPAVELLQEQVDRLLEIAAGHPITIDLQNQTVTTPFQDRFAFEVDPFRKHCLLEGLDEIGLTLERSAAIETHEQQRAQALPWLDAPQRRDAA